LLYEKTVYRTMGDRSLLVELGDGISPVVNRKVRELFLGLDHRKIGGILELVPSYRSLLIVYDPLKIGLHLIQEIIADLRITMDQSLIPEPKTIQIPVAYGGEYGPDLDFVAGYHGISPEEVVRLHAGPTYQVYMIGFTPGFAYMGELLAGIATPRKETPRTTVPKGSVAIAQRQTGIYPVESPGGWQIIGRTPIRLFDPGKKPPAPIEMGDMVTFYPIRTEEMKHWQP
jgi:inhibitor of KinA